MRILSRLLLSLVLCGCAQRQTAAPQPEPAGAGQTASQTARPSPTRFEAEIQAFEASDRERPVAPGSVVFVGSSSIRLWTTLAEDFPGVPVVNRGFGGSELEDVLFYLDRTVIRYAPRMVLVYAGDNDLNSGKSPERVLADYQQIVQRIHARLPGTRIGFIAIKPSPSRWHLETRVRMANALIEAHTARDPRLFYVDVFTPMLGPDGAPRSELFLADMLHMKPEGYTIWKAAVAPYLSAGP